MSDGPAMNDIAGTGRPEPGSVDQDLERALDLLGGRPAEALAIAELVLDRLPRHPIAMLVVGVANRMVGNDAASVAALEQLIEVEPNLAMAHFEHGISLAACGHDKQAVSAIRRAATLDPELPEVWRVLADHLSATGNVTDADATHAQHLRRGARDRSLLRAASALYVNDIPGAEALLRLHLHHRPRDVAAIRMLAEVAARSTPQS